MRERERERWAVLPHTPPHPRRPLSCTNRLACPQFGQPVETSVRFVEPAKWDAAKKYLVNIYIPALNAVAGRYRSISCYEDRKQYSITCNSIYKVRVGVWAWMGA